MRRALALTLLLVIAGVAIWFFRSRPEPPLPVVRLGTNRNETITGEVAREFIGLEARESQANQTIWAKEMLAQDCARVVEDFWDQINRSTNKLAAVAEFSVPHLFVGTYDQTNARPHGIQELISHKIAHDFDPTAWRNLIQQAQSNGWQLDQCEFRHNAFSTDTAGHPRQSLFYFSAHLQNPASAQRLVLEGDLPIAWTNSTNGIQIQSIDASQLTLKRRTGEPFFSPILAQVVVPPERSRVIDPLIVYDLDGDGIPEILLVAKNLLFRRQPNGSYTSEQLCRYPAPYIGSAVLADFDRDGIPDLLYCKYEGVFLFRGSVGGHFDEKEIPVAKLTPNISYASVITCGDIDGDGDLDIFIGQYKEPYEGGLTPKPFYDANDGNPAFLLLNDGHGRFTDATAQSGLDKKRFRRTYSASFVDLNNSGHLDLVVVSDFAGADIYLNDGHGHFTDVTATALPDPHAFGMAHALADFNRDGRLDLLMIGMTSPTIQRLDRAHLWRDLPETDRTLRTRMTAGNRLYLGDGTAHFVQNDFSQSIAHSGWSWGCGAFDADNDGFLDLYIANGLESNASVHDYEAEYWLHDQFIGAEREEPASDLYFKSKFTRTRGRDFSYAGYEKNRLYLNEEGKTFFEVGYLAGVALELDSRNVVATDLDGDGREDLVVATLEVWPAPKQVLHIFQNQIPETGNWIGVRLQESRTHSAIGATVTLHDHAGSTVRQIVTGDSYRSQHPTTVHFGLSQRTSISSIDIRYMDGTTSRLTNPAINQYHVVP
jgi:hypothetical protein